MNQVVIVKSEKLAELLDERRNNPPFIAELFADNGFYLTIGIGGGVSFVQHSRTNGELPYLVALPAQPRVNSRYVDFLINNTPTPIPGRFVLTFDEMKQIALYFLETGERCTAFSWKSI